MTPIYSVSYLINHMPTNSVCVRQIYLSLAIGNAMAYIKNIFFGENRHPMFFSDVWLKPPFCHFVVNIILICSKKKMGGIAAGWLIALMKNAKPLRNLSIMDDPTKAMCLRFLNVVPNESTVSLGTASHYPNPASGKWNWLDSLKKPFGDRLLRSHCRVSFKTGDRLGAVGVYPPSVPLSYTLSGG